MCMGSSPAPAAVVQPPPPPPPPAAPPAPIGAPAQKKVAPGASGSGGTGAYNTNSLTINPAFSMGGMPTASGLAIPNG